MSGGIGIEGKGDRVGESFEQARMVLGKGGSLGGDRVSYTGPVTGNDIELTFADEGAAGFFECGAGQVYAVENTALVEDFGFGGVDVFGGFGVVVQNAGTESDDSAEFIPDRKHESSAEAVVAAALGVVLSFLDGQPCGDDLFACVALALSPGEDGIQESGE